MVVCCLSFLHMGCQTTSFQTTIFWLPAGGRRRASRICINHVLPPLLGAAKARLGASSSRRRQWVESEPCGQLHLNFLLFPPPPASLLATLFRPLSMHGELRLCPTRARLGASTTRIRAGKPRRLQMRESFAPMQRNAISTAPAPPQPRSQK